MCIGLQPCKIAKSRPQSIDTCGVADLKGKVIILKMIQIPESLFVELMKYHVLGIEECLPEIQKGLEQKYEAKTFLRQAAMHRLRHYIASSSFSSFFKTDIESLL